MTQENKDLLLKDLCARLPYGVICHYDCAVPSVGKVINYDRLNGIVPIQDTIGFMVGIHSVNALFDNIKPYLRPMSSMTEEEFEELKEYSGLKYDQLDLASCQNGTYKCLDFYLSEVPSYVVILVFDWLNAHHFDYRGLIEKGLAIAVTPENNPYIKNKS